MSERVAKRWPGALELARQLAVVVDLAVLDDGRRAVLVRDRLVAGVEVDDREPPRREPDAAVDERALGVRPAVRERRRHRGEPIAVDAAPSRDDSADPAHAPSLSPCPTPSGVSESGCGRIVTLFCKGHLALDLARADDDGGWRVAQPHPGWGFGTA